MNVYKNKLNRIEKSENKETDKKIRGKRQAHGQCAKECEYMNTHSLHLFSTKNEKQKPNVTYRIDPNLMQKFTKLILLK